MSVTTEMIKVMQAFEDGKQIQFKGKYSTPKEWTDITTPIWDWNYLQFRIKPEEPKYRPYENTAEMIEDYKAKFGVQNPDYTMPLIWVRRKFDPYLKHLITSFDYSVVWFWDGEMGNTMNGLFEEYVYFDGTPCWKLVEE